MQQLSKQELELARLIGDNLTYEEIGKKLGISARSAKYQTTEMRKKLGLKNKRSIPRILRELGMM